MYYLNTFCFRSRILINTNFLMSLFYLLLFVGLLFFTICCLFAHEVFWLKLPVLQNMPIFFILSISKMQFINNKKTTIYITWRSKSVVHIRALYIWIYICMCGEREGEGERERKADIYAWKHIHICKIIWNSCYFQICMRLILLVCFL